MFTKDLSKLVAKVLEKEEKIKNKITDLEARIVATNSLVQAEVKKLVEYELSEDEDQQNQCKKAIKGHREKIVELQDLLNAYRDELNSFSTSESNLLKIKKAAIQEREARASKATTLLSEKEKAEQQIKKLQEKVKIISLEHDRVAKDEQEIVEIRKIIKYIDPRAEKLEKLDDFVMDNFISKWLIDGNTERYFTMFQ